MGGAATLDILLNSHALSRFELMLTGARRVVLVCHARPDGDGIGSMLGLALILSARGHEVQCVSPNGIPKAIAWTPGQELVVVFEEEAERVRAAITECELLIALDFNALHRVDSALEEVLSASDAPRIMIDHHPSPSDEFDLYFSFTPASSTCEVVYEVVATLWSEAAITPPVAQCLYMGLMTDTGSFAYSCSRRRTFEVAGALVHAGADVPTIRSHVYGSYSEGRVRLFGYALYRCMRLVAGGMAAVMPLGRRMLNNFGYEPGDTEGLVNEPLTIDGVKVSVMLTERNAKSVRVSLRSRGEITVNGLAKQYFNGGGHAQASGGLLRMDMESATNYTIEVVERFFDQKGVMN